MSFGLPAVKPNPGDYTSEDLAQGHYGVPDMMTHGMLARQQQLSVAHPLELSEKLFAGNRERLSAALLRNTQGLHAVLRLRAELRAVDRVGRLPCLPSAGLARDVLTGRDLELGFEDVLGTPEFSEALCQPHLTVEQRLGIL
ncbi:proteasome maturation protein [Bacillus rossius redtenbacheri]|uniref:proteasome maturation protein n=1 Tax=Bacillus rossius redtenbacheri TaxID=93214 RepID=UPI002FDE0D75